MFKFLNLKEYCNEYKISIWECPPFIFTIMGVVIIFSILAAYFVGRIYVDPFIVLLIIFAVTALLFILSFIIVKSFEKMAQISKEKSEFISIMSHQLRTPLSSIKWQLDLLLKKDASLTAETGRKAILTMEEQNEKMIKTVNDMLEVNRLENNALVFEKSVFSFTDLVENVIEKFQKEALLINAEIIFSPPQKEVKIKTDKIRIGIVISHLIDNAIRYSPNGGKISVFLENVDNKIRFSISDERVGIPKQDLAYVFKKFYRGDTSRKYKSDGLGIGLYLAKAIVESFGGKIDFTSIEGKGSTFWFTLPISLVKINKES